MGGYRVVLLWVTWSQSPFGFGVLSDTTHGLGVPIGTSGSLNRLSASASFRTHRGRGRLHGVPGNSRLNRLSASASFRTLTASEEEFYKTGRGLNRLSASASFRTCVAGVLPLPLILEWSQSPFGFGVLSDNTAQEHVGHHLLVESQSPFGFGVLSDMGRKFGMER